jgi:hypothetical protein
VRRRGRQEEEYTTTPTVHKQHNAAREKRETETEKTRLEGKRGAPWKKNKNKKQWRDFGVQWQCLRLVQFI